MSNPLKLSELTGFIKCSKGAKKGFSQIFNRKNKRINIWMLAFILTFTGLAGTLGGCGNIQESLDNQQMTVNPGKERAQGQSGSYANRLYK